VARNAAADRARRKARAPTVEALHDREARPTADATDGTDVMRAHALTALQALPEAYRETLVWRLVEGLSGPEIAARTGLTPGSVRVNLCKGMAMLRARLAEDRSR
jgi:RNA polymerase sigma-70 factor (ECF subfamily)